jgi:hypothetical protein
MKKIAMLIMLMAIAASAARLINCKYEGRTTSGGHYVSGYWGLYEGSEGYFEYFSGNKYCPYNL